MSSMKNLLVETADRIGTEDVNGPDVVAAAQRHIDYEEAKQYLADRSSANRIARLDVCSDSRDVFKRTYVTIRPFQSIRWVMNQLAASERVHIDNIRAFIIRVDVQLSGGAI